MKYSLRRTVCVAFGFVSLLVAVAVSAQPKVTKLNNGNLILEDIPAIPDSVVEDLNRFQNTRSAPFRDWTRDGGGLYITTRFGDVSQLHQVAEPGGARNQITFFKEPIGSVAKQPEGDLLSFTMDAGGSEYAQIFLLNPATGESEMITDGESRNGVISWRRDGKAFAYQSTRRNGASNDLWLSEVGKPEKTRLILESPDGSWWAPGDWNGAGTKMLVQQYISITDSRIYVLDVESGDLQLVRGSPESPSVNYSVAFDDSEQGFYFLTDEGGEFPKLSYQQFGEKSMCGSCIYWNQSICDSV